MLTLKPEQPVALTGQDVSHHASFDLHCCISMVLGMSASQTAERGMGNSLSVRTSMRACCDMLQCMPTSRYSTPLCETCLCPDAPLI